MFPNDGRYVGHSRQDTRGHQFRFVPIAALTVCSPPMINIARSNIFVIQDARPYSQERSIVKNEQLPK